MSLGPEFGTHFMSPFLAPRFLENVYTPILHSIPLRCYAACFSPPPPHASENQATLYKTEMFFLITVSSSDTLET
jgi:hypothetical protein